jgi:hypothetical protein
LSRFYVKLLADKGNALEGFEEETLELMKEVRFRLPLVRRLF